MKMKEHADRKSYVAPINLKEGDLVLCRQSKVNKLTTPFNSQPFRVVKVTGSRVTAVADGRYITRHITFFKPLKHEEDIHFIHSFIHKSILCRLKIRKYS